MPPPPLSPCPDEDLLIAFSEGRLAGPAQNETIKHLGGCDVCLAAVGSVDGSQPPTQPVPQHLSTAFRPGELVARRYEIVRFVARGGMGEVYEAEDQLLGVRVALKTVLLANGDDPRAVQQIRREVQVARAINHPGVCRVFDLGEHVITTATGHAINRFFLTMEFLDGTTLGQRIRGGGPLDGELLSAIARQLADALTAAHDVGVVHRDFKSDNVMLMPGGAGAPAAQSRVPRAVIMDFGLARGGPTGAGLASTGGIMVGSAAYMAPEQVEGGPIREAADVYSFGVVLFEIATGRLPFSAATAMAIATKRLFEPPPAPRAIVPTLDARLEQIILRCLARYPQDRFPSMGELREALAALDSPAPAPMPTAAEDGAGAGIARPRKRQLAWALGAAAIAAAAIGGLVNRTTEQTPAGTRTHLDVTGAPRRSATTAPAASQAPTEAPPAGVPREADASPRPPSGAIAGAPTEGRVSPPGAGSAPAAASRRQPVRQAAASTERRPVSATPADARVIDSPAPAPSRNDEAPPSQSPLDGFANPFK